MAKNNLERREGLFQLILTGHHLSPREVKAGTESRSLKDKPWGNTLLPGLLPGLLPLACTQPVFLYNPRVGPPSWPPSRAGHLLTSTSNSESASQPCPQAKLIDATLQLRFPFLWNGNQEYEPQKSRWAEAKLWAHLTLREETESNACCPAGFSTYTGQDSSQAMVWPRMSGSSHLN